VLLYRAPFTYEGQIWCTIADPRYTFTCGISSRSVYSVVLWQRNPQFLPFYGLLHLVMSPIGINLRKLSTVRAQLQTFAIQRHQNCFCTPTPSWRNIQTDKQTNKQTNRQTKNSTFLATPAAGKIRVPYQTWHGDRGPRARSCTSKTFGSLTHSFAARGAENLGVTGTPHIKTPMTP